MRTWCRDIRRGAREPWLAFTGDSLLIGDVGRPDLHVAGDAAGQARLVHGSLARLLELADGVVVLPSHYAGSVCRSSALGQPVLLDRLRASAECDALRLAEAERVRGGIPGHAAASPEQQAIVGRFNRQRRRSYTWVE